MLMTSHILRTYRRQVDRLPGEPEREFARRAELVIPDLRRYTLDRHPRRNIRAVIRYSADMSLATVEVSALKDGRGL